MSDALKLRNMGSFFPSISRSTQRAFSPSFFLSTVYAVSMRMEREFELVTRIFMSASVSRSAVIVLKKSQRPPNSILRARVTVFPRRMRPFSLASAPKPTLSASARYCARSESGSPEAGFFIARIFSRRGSIGKHSLGAIIKMRVEKEGMVIGEEEGEELLKAAREAIGYYFEYGEAPSVLKGVDLDKYSEARGVFVTLKRNGQLRGCIGFPLPTFPLGIAVVKSAISAAFEDFRFPPLRREEMDELEIEISVLSVPEKIDVSKPGEYLEKIKVGRDGLIIEYMGHTGLLLPQVPGEQGWGVEEYLEGICMKAGLPAGSWKEEGVVLKAFTAKIFGEGK